MINKQLFLVLLCIPLVSLAADRVSVDLTVVDNRGQPVSDARVAMSFLLAHDMTNVFLDTDKDGRASAERRALYGVGVLVKKDGYYNSGTRTGYGDQDLVLVLREKRNPIPMYAKQEIVRLSKDIQVFTYDFMRGRVVHSEFGGDIIIRSSTTVRNSTPGKSEYSQVITLTFPNDKDGVIVIKPEEAWSVSDFKTEYEAPIAGYSSSIEITKARGQAGKDSNVGAPLYLRLRTETDEEGNITSAIYCKIPTGIVPMAGLTDSPGFKMTFYCNPTPNDRNVEFGTNLFKNLKHEERVREP